MELEHAIATRRSIRRFDQRPVPREELRVIADAGRLAASAGNRQPCRFLAVAEAELVRRMHQYVAWLAGAGDPPEGAQPMAYIVILADPAVNRNYTSDCAAAAQNLLLAAHGRGLGGCWIGSVNRSAAQKLLVLPGELEIYAVIALGYPAEEAVAIDGEGEMTVTRDDEEAVQVLKRRLADVLRFDRWEE